ncbi:TPA: hypothetical protein RQJ36_002314 [Vibrio vulnificus]|uniref:hypothetical protein n=1 Tax=Vibrio alginolyticus TaxID=663 RepID=UPI0001BDF3A6|nr:hypothetical protein VMC_34470 [Vibrio alginolyticus 40B]HAS6234928.1 hypothetical protein [Vibrio vulnificus]HDY7445667.1 hypothetical protein [Vibrio vulnificus]HDY7891104.1 hypothetical protein [Vibrio vulnificus]
MLLVHVVCAVGLIIGLLALYASQIEQWNNKHLLSTANTNNAFEKGGDEVAEIIGKTSAEKLIDAGFTHKQAEAIVSILEETK